MIDAILSAVAARDERPASRLAIVDDDGAVLQVVVAGPDWTPPDGAKLIPTGRANIGDVYDAKRGGFPADLDYAEPTEEPERRRVARIDIVRRLAAVGLLAAAEKAIAGADALTRQEWATADLGVYADDPKTIGFLRAIGADPDVILAP